MKVLAVIDMQNDFIDGALGTREAQAIVPRVRAKVDAALAAGDTVIYTRDTHGENYLETQEGRNLPVIHCVRGTKGWEIAADVWAAGCDVIDKPSFGSMELAEHLAALQPAAVELVGLCTDICVISNALLIKAALPEANLIVNSGLCAGTTPENHAAALKVMQSCLIDVK